MKNWRNWGKKISVVKLWTEKNCDNNLFIIGSTNREGTPFRNHLVCYATYIYIYMRWACMYVFVHAFFPLINRLPSHHLTHPHRSIHNFISFYRSFVSVVLCYHCNLVYFIIRYLIIASNFTPHNFNYDKIYYRK